MCSNSTDSSVDDASKPEINADSSTMNKDATSLCVEQKQYCNSVNSSEGTKKNDGEDWHIEQFVTQKVTMCVKTSNYKDFHSQFEDVLHENFINSTGALQPFAQETSDGGQPTLLVTGTSVSRKISSYVKTLMRSVD